MIENPVRSPMVPPMAASISSNFAALSFTILSNVGVPKKILTNLNLFFHTYSARIKPYTNHKMDIFHSPPDNPGGVEENILYLS